MKNGWKVSLAFAWLLLIAGVLLLAFQVEGLERRIEVLEVAEARHGQLEEVVEGLEGQVRGRESGWFVVKTYDGEGRSISLSGIGFVDTPYTGYLTGEVEGDIEVVLSDSETGEWLDTFDLQGIVRPGDLVIAYHSFGPLTPGQPLAPNWWIPPFYWNEETGLLVAILHYDGSYVKPVTGY
ncbi:hypothetical protein IID21_03295 [Patescibacteria group bacterium]|nr:hypothetical protein [Patescibacteria group bacterium]